MSSNNDPSFADTVTGAQAPEPVSIFKNSVNLLEDIFLTPPRCPDTEGLYLNPIQLYYLDQTCQTPEGSVLLGKLLAYAYIAARAGKADIANVGVARALMEAASASSLITRDNFNKIMAATSYNVRTL